MFDNNRNMEDFESVIRRQEEIIQQQRQQLEQQQQQMEQQQQQMEQLQQQMQQQQVQQQIQQQQVQQQIQQQRIQQQQSEASGQQYNLMLSPKDLIDQFRRLKPLDKNHNPRAFIRSVESAIELCHGNQEVLKYGLHIVANEKIQGDYGRRIRMLEVGTPWQQLKEEILIHSQPKKTYAEIYNFCRKVLITVLLLTSLIPSNQATLLISQINENNGFVEIKTGDVEIVNETCTLLHIINIREVEGILNNISMNIESLNLHSDNVLQNEIYLIRSKLKTLLPSERRIKRGLINAGGKLAKWLFGTMDDEDRQQVFDHLAIIDQNTHNTIKNVNKQIIINDSLNRSLEHLKIAVENDRKEIESSFKELKEINNNFLNKLFYLDQLSKLKTLEHKIDQIQDNIVSAKNNFVHPSIFTSQEIVKFNIDFYKLKTLKVGIITCTDESLVIAISIPDSFIKTELKIIVPIPNNNKIEIDSDEETIVNISGIAYKYEENVKVKKLKKSKH
ncbi:uncharacterized protein, partial [Musca autumnalis]|uniref:uncharacterized protein n=1 Tax=Musca autumnalis TaxID=221902 RepID=UPI003CEF2A59